MDNKKCSPCGKGFATCASATNGTMCMAGHYKDNSNCTMCPS